MLILGLGLNILNMDPDLPIQLRLSPRMFAENVSRGQHVGQESFEWGNSQVTMSGLILIKTHDLVWDVLGLEA